MRALAEEEVAELETRIASLTVKARDLLIPKDPLEDRAAVVEIGSSEPGEIERLTAIAAPDIAIVTCVAESHLSGFGSLGGVAREKASLVAGLEGRRARVTGGRR